MTKKTNEHQESCSFCGKKQNEVKSLKSGPSSNICNECIELCEHVIKNKTKEMEK